MTAAVTFLVAMVAACSGGTENAASEPSTPAPFERPCYRLGAAGSEEVDCGDAEPGTVFDADGEPVTRDEASPSPEGGVWGPDPALAEEWRAWWGDNVDLWFEMGNAIFDATAADVEAQVAVALDAFARIDRMPDRRAQDLFREVGPSLGLVRTSAAAGSIDLAMELLQTVRYTIDLIVNLMPEPGA